MLPQAVKKQIVHLQQKKYRQDQGEFLLEGVKGIEEALKHSADILTIVVDGPRREEPDIERVCRAAEKKQIPVVYCGRKDIGDIKTTDTFAGVLAIVAEEEISLDELIGGTPILVLDGVKDPGNLGTIIRTADWFGIKNIILSEDSVEIYNPKTVRSTMGSIFHVNILKSTKIVQTMEHLKKQGYDIVALDLQGKPIEEIKSGKKNVYIFGSESHGVSKPLLELAEKYTIRGRGDAESLNVAVSVGITLHSIVFSPSLR